LEHATSFDMQHCAEHPRASTSGSPHRQSPIGQLGDPSVGPAQAATNNAIPTAQLIRMKRITSSLFWFQLRPTNRV